ncbi:spore germination protein GerW family protein [Kutzneria sp. 744]|uniref:spore germination protein GerW family protein n=1 Tax=Kutzneria sp. (strain 744) TaxID=345341 RepID=UPI0003EED803|nr:spore germination protein GerW family protein [Kutzneria sp. 744]EWM15247.1 sporulation protein YtfJ [Kutzneria sp. 744]
MKIEDLLDSARESVSVRRVYGEPVQDNGLIVIPAASVGGGGGGGQGHDQRGQDGEGGGFGLTARPVGAYVIKNDNVRWVPAVDVNRLVATVGAVAIVGLLVAARIVRAQSRRAGQPA